MLYDWRVVVVVVVVVEMVEGTGIKGLTHISLYSMHVISLTGICVYVVVCNKLHGSST